MTIEDVKMQLNQKAKLAGYNGLDNFGDQPIETWFRNGMTVEQMWVEILAYEDAYDPEYDDYDIDYD